MLCLPVIAIDKAIFWIQVLYPGYVIAKFTLFFFIPFGVKRAASFSVLSVLKWRKVKALSNKPFVTSAKMQKNTDIVACYSL